METRVCVKCGRAFAANGKQPRCPKCGGTGMPENTLRSASAMLFVPEDVENLPPAVEQAYKNPKNVFGKYILVRLIGRGGSAEVYRAWHTTLKKYVAVKRIFSNNPDAILRMQREARNAARLRHPNIVTAHDMGTVDIGGVQWTYIGMDYIDGKPLGYVDIPLMGKLRVIKQIADALHYAHQQGVIHRDVKPGNILISRQGNAYLTDFGLARQVSDPRLTVTEAIIGTPYYMSPEQARGGPDVDFRTDIYSLGATLYEVLTGTPPFIGETPYEIIDNILKQEALPPRALNPEVDAQLEAICMKAMEKDRDKRVPSAEAFSKELQRYLQGGPASMRMWMYNFARNFREKVRAAALWVSLFLVLVSAGLIAWYVITTRRPAAPPSSPVVIKAAPEPVPIDPIVAKVARMIDDYDLLAFGPERSAEVGTRLLTEAQNLLALSARSPEKSYQMGRLYHRMGLTGDALASLSDAIKQREDGRMFAERAWVRIHAVQDVMHPARTIAAPAEGAIEEALKEHAEKLMYDINYAWEKGYAAAEDAEFAKAFLNHAYRQNAEAIEALGDLISATEGRLALQLEARRLRGDGLRSERRPDDALADYEDFLAVRGNDAGGLIRVVRTYLDSLSRQVPTGRRPADFLKAKGYFKKLSIIDPENPLAEFLEGEVYRLSAESEMLAGRDPLPDLDNSIQSLLRAQRMERTSPEVHLSLGRAYFLHAKAVARRSVEEAAAAADIALANAKAAYRLDSSLNEALQLQSEISSFRDRLSPQ